VRPCAPSSIRLHLAYVYRLSIKNCKHIPKHIPKRSPSPCSLLQLTPVHVWRRGMFACHAHRLSMTCYFLILNVGSRWFCGARGFSSKRPTGLCRILCSSTRTPPLTPLSRCPPYLSFCLGAFLPLAQSMSAPSRHSSDRGTLRT
jgi:hypothetical protein